jgi:hypothetical protein
MEMGPDAPSPTQEKATPWVPTRYLVQVRRGQEVTSLDGSPLPSSEATRLLCDHSAVQPLLSAAGEPLPLGRKTRVWSTSQRRAILARDGGVGHIPSCQRRIVHIHHLRPWSKGGQTDITNDVLICSRHHALLHDGFRAVESVAKTVVRERPAGSQGARQP